MTSDERWGRGNCKYVCAIHLIELLDDGHMTKQP